MNAQALIWTAVAVGVAVLIFKSTSQKKRGKVSVAVKDEKVPKIGRISTEPNYKEPSGNVGGLPRRNPISTNTLLSEPDLKGERITTLYESFQRSIKKFGNREFAGERKLIKLHKTEVEIKGVKKHWFHYEMDHFDFKSFTEVGVRVQNAAAGLRAIGLQPKERVGMYMETCMDWMILEQACYSQSMIILTVYSNLGEEALEYAINQGEVKYLFSNGDALKTVAKIIDTLPNVTHVIYSGEPDAGKALLEEKGKKLLSVAELEKLGSNKPVAAVPPTADDLACIMYTSGSTGNPKGVMITHRNMLSAIVGLDALYDISENDSYLSYLPLAHILALVVNNLCIFLGVKIGFGNPRTLLDAAMKDSKGDVAELRPTAFAAVPTVCDRIKKGVLAKIEHSSPIVQSIFHFAFKMKSFCLEHGLPTFLWDKLVFDKMKAALGGRVRLMVSGGAPLSSECQRFLTVAFGVPILQGYGLTETSGAGAALLEGDFSIGTVGGPIPCDEIKLVDVPDMGYSTSANPPKGEIWIRGPNVSIGYFKMPEKTEEDFKDGWFHTGDVGTWDSKGYLRIVDRVKNLIKTPHGEYIALEKLESIYKNSKFVANICVIVDPSRFGIIAVVQPPADAIKHWGAANSAGDDPAHIVKNQKFVKEVLDNVNEVGRKNNLKSFELLNGVLVEHEEWTPENSFLTAAMKLNRQAVKKSLEKDINALLEKCTTPA